MGRIEPIRTDQLKTIQVEDRRSSSLFTTSYYNDKTHSPDGKFELIPVWEVKPASVILSISIDNEILGWR
jgi:hypothetical protein